MRELTCSKCNATLVIRNDNRDVAFCEYCGNKLVLDDYRETFRYVDEADVKRAENERYEAEASEKRRIANRPVCLMMGALLLLVAIALVVLDATVIKDYILSLFAMMFLAFAMGIIMMTFEK